MAKDNQEKLLKKIEQLEVKLDKMSELSHRAITSIGSYDPSLQDYYLRNYYSLINHSC